MNPTESSLRGQLSSLLTLQAGLVADKANDTAGGHLNCAADEIRAAILALPLPQASAS